MEGPQVGVRHDARIAPDYYLHDAVVPRTKLVDVLRTVYSVAAEQRLTMMNVFHAGDGNLHPLIVFNGREPDIWPRVHDAGSRILAACIDAGGVLSGEHGVGLEKRDLMPLQFSADDLAAQGRLSTRSILTASPTRRRCCRRDRAAARSAGSAARSPQAVDLMGARRSRPSFRALPRLLRRLRDSVAAIVMVGGRTHADVGNPVRSRMRCASCACRRASSSTTPMT